MGHCLQIDDVEVHVEGNGTHSIVMLHGWPDTYRLWDQQVEFFAPNYRCVRFTLPGFDAARLRRAHSLDEVVTTLKNVVEQTCPGETVTLMLHDWGCLFGYQFALAYPGLVRRVIGVDVGDAGSREHVRELPLKAKAMVLGYQGWLAIAWRTGGRLGDRMTRWMARAMHCPSDAQFIGSHMGYPYYITWTGAYGSYRGARPFMPSVPMLYLWGRKNPIKFHSSAWIERVRAQPNSEAIEFNTGHWVMTSKPLEFNQAVAAWLIATG